MANTKTYIGGSKSSSPWREIRIELSETGTSVSNNTSTISYEVWLDNGSTNFSDVRVGCKVIIDNVTVLNRSYSSSSQYTCGSNASVKIASGTTTVAHNSDGTKSITASTIKATCSSAGIVATQTVTGSGNAWALTPIARASSVSISTNTTIMGQARTLTITRSDSSFTHTLTYTFGSATGTIATKTSSTSVSFTPPTSLSSQLTNAKSGTGTITCTTYNGNTPVGTSTCSFTATIPASTVTISGGTMIGDSMSFSINRAALNLTHKIQYKFATQTSQTTLTSSAGNSYTWNPTTGQTSDMVQAVATDNASGSGTITLTTYNGTATVGTSTKTWTGKIPNSSFSVTSSTLTMGSSQTFTIDPAGTNLTHKLTYAFGSLTNQSIGTGIKTSKSWTVPTSLAAQLSNAKQGTVTVTLTTYNGTAVCGSTPYPTQTFTAVAPVSTMSFASSVAMGSTLAITINRATTNMTHTLEYKFGSDNYASVTGTWTDSASWSPQYSLGSKIPTATSGTWTLQLTTKIGTTPVGSTTKTVTVTVPNNSSTKPTLTGVSYKPYPQNASVSLDNDFKDMYIAGYSKVQGIFTSGTQAGATSPPTVALIVGGATAKTGTSSPLTATNFLNTTGTVKARLKATDSRGYTLQTAESSITVYSYTEPSVTPKSGKNKVICGRSNSGGTLVSNGTRLHIEADKSFSSLNSKNTCTLSYVVYNSSGTQIDTGVLNSDTYTSNTDILSDVTSTYRVVLTASDKFGNSNNYNVNIPSDSVDMNFRVGGGGIGLGMYSQGSGRLDSNWNGYFYNALEADRYTSIMSAADGGYNVFRLVPRWSYTDLLGGSSDGFPSATYLEAWVKEVVATYPTDTSRSYIGGVVPLNGGIVLCNIPSCVDSSGGLPKTAIGLYIPYNTSTSIHRGAIVRFGTDNYTFWYNVLESSDSESVALSWTDNVIFTSSNFSSGFHLYRSGKVCTLHVYATPSSTAGGSSFVTVGTIPSGYRPQIQIGQGVTLDSNTYTDNQIRITTGGNIQVYKNHTGTAGFRTNLTWIIA